MLGYTAFRVCLRLSAARESRPSNPLVAQTIAIYVQTQAFLNIKYQGYSRDERQYVYHPLKQLWRLLSDIRDMDLARALLVARRTLEVVFPCELILLVWQLLDDPHCREMPEPCSAQINYDEYATRRSEVLKRHMQPPEEQQHR